MKFDVVVIGDGIAAHAAAAVAARRGMTCMLLREPDTTGGRAAIFHKEGFTFDFGVLANRVAGAHPEIALKASGAPARFHPGGGALCFNGTKLVAFPDGAARAVLSPMLGIGGRIAWSRAIKNLRQQTLDPYAFKRDLAEWLLKLPGADQDVSEHASLISGWMFDAADLGRMPIGTFAEGLKGGAGRAPVTPLGGWEHVFMALESAVMEKGDIMDGVEIKNIVFDGDTALGVNAGGDFIEAGFVIAAVPVSRLLELAPEDSFPEETARRLRKLEPLRGISLYLGLDKPVTGVRGQIVTADPFTRGLVPTNLEPALAPRGCQIMSWFMPVPAAVLSNADLLKNEKLKLKKITELVFPGVSKHLMVEEWREHAEVRSAAAVIGQTREDLPPVSAFKAKNAAMANDAAGIGGPKGDAALKAALEAASIAERQLNKRA